MLIAILVLVVGLFILSNAANYLVNSSIKIAKSLKVSEMFIGLTIVAAGTSAPELAVSAVAALNGNGALSVGNVIGSNIFNLGFILGLSAIISPLLINKKMVYRDGLFLVFITFIILAMLWDQKVAMIEGIVLILLLIGYNTFLWIKKDVPTEEDEEHIDINLKGFLFLISGILLFLSFHFSMTGEGKGVLFNTEFGIKTGGLILIGVLALGFIISLIFKDVPSIFKKAKGNIFNVLIFISSLALLVLSSEHVVSSAVYIATFFGISQWAIGATIVAAGTSLPEIATTVAAIKKKKFDLGIGNVIGSDIFNVLGIIGISSIIAPLNLESKCVVLQNCNTGVFEMFFRDNIFSVSVLILTLVITLIFFRTGWKLSRKEGIILFIFAIFRMIFEINPNMFSF